MKRSHPACLRHQVLVCSAVFVAACVSFLPSGARGQQDAAPLSPAPPQLPSMQEIRPGVFAIGKLVIDQQARTVTFPGAVNMDKGLLEYLLVTPQGATHESLLVSEIAPNDVHLAMLLLGAKGAGIQTPSPETAPPEQITDDFLKTAAKPVGDHVSISVKWKDKAGEARTARVEDWLLRSSTNKPAERGPWLYTGSMFGFEGAFRAQQDGLFAALIINPAALINNPRKGNDNDEAWAVNEKAVPPLQTPVEIVIRLDEPAQDASSKESAPDQPRPNR